MARNEPDSPQIRMEGTEKREFQGVLERIADRMSLKIPEPVKPKPKPAQSWRLLKPGQLLRNRERIVTGTDTIPAGTEFEVSRVNSLGAEVREKTVFEPDVAIQFYLTNSDWKKQWERVRAQRKKK